MKKLLINLVAWCCFLPVAHTQVSFGLRLGMSPSANPETPSLLINRENPFHESQFDVRQVDYTGQFGFTVRTEYQRFWFMGEALVGQSSTHYTLHYTYRRSEEGNTAVYKTNTTYMGIPVTAGVKLGLLEIFSGFQVSRELKLDSELTGLDGYSSAVSPWRFGWHSGAGINLGMILADIRFQQEFTNYGEGQFIHDQELTLKNVPSRWVASVGFRL